MPRTATLEEARDEAAVRAVRTAAVLVPLWHAARMWTAAAVLALFPFLFIMDRAVETSLSPVLPGLAVLFLLILGLPFLLVEAGSRRFRRHPLDWQERRADRARHNGRTALTVAAIWIVVWFAAGT